MSDFTDYEKKVLKEIAQHIVEPNVLIRLLQTAGKPLDKIMVSATDSKNKVVKSIAKTISSNTKKGIEKAVNLSNHICSDKAIIDNYIKKGVSINCMGDIKHQELNKLDMIANSYDMSGAVIVGLEGAIMGLASSLAEGLPGAIILVPAIVASDVLSSIVLLSRNVCQIATSYGYSSQDPINLPHILAAMVPTESTEDEAFITTKAIVVRAIHECGEFLVKNAGKEITTEIIEKEAPQLIKLINYLAERLGVILTEKELGMIVPVAGAILNGGVNVAFQQVGHSTAQDYFRRLYLEEKYGSDAVNELLEKEIIAIKEKKAS